MFLGLSQAMFGNVRQLTAALVSGSKDKREGIVRGDAVDSELGDLNDSCETGILNSTMAARKRSSSGTMAKHSKQTRLADRRNAFVWYEYRHFSKHSTACL